MQSRIQFPVHAQLAAIFLASALAGCGSSDSPVAQQGPGGEGELPAEFAVFISDEPVLGASELLSGGLPFLYDFTTGERRSLGGGLPADQIIPNQTAALSPDGRWLYAVTGTFQENTSHVIDLKNGTTRRLPLPASGSGNDGDDGGNPFFSFCDDSSRVAIEAPVDGFQRALFVCDPDGTSLSRIRIGGNDVEPIDWLGDSDRMLVTTYDDALDTEVLAIVNGDGSVSASMQLSTVLDISIDAISVAADGSAVATLIAIFSQSGPETYEVVVLDLAGGTQTRFMLQDADDGDVVINDTGEYVAILSETPANPEGELRIGDVATGAMEIATLPAAHSGDLGLSDDRIFWEPGGSRLAFISSHRDESADELTIASFGTSPMPVEPTVIPDDDVRTAVWSPSGRFLAFVDTHGQDALLVFDADGVAPPEQVTDGTFSGNSSGALWSPDGAFLLVNEQVASTGARELLVYDASNFERAGSLGRAHDNQDLQNHPFDTGVSPVAFSRNARQILWRTESSGGEPSRLLSASLDDIASPAVDIASASGNSPRVFQFWLQR